MPARRRAKDSVEAATTATTAAATAAALHLVFVLVVAVCALLGPLVDRGQGAFEVKAEPLSGLVGRLSVGVGVEELASRTLTPPSPYSPALPSA